MARLGSVVTAQPRRFARYSQRNRVPAALLLFGLAVGLWSFRRGRMPTARQAAGFMVAAVVIVAAASVMPELVVGFLAAALLALAIGDSAAIAELARRLWSLIGDVSPALSTFSATGTPPAVSTLRTGTAPR